MLNEHEPKWPWYSAAVGIIVLGAAALVKISAQKHEVEYIAPADLEATINADRDTIDILRAQLTSCRVDQLRLMR